MNETSIFLELIKTNGEVIISVGGGTCNNGQLNFHDDLTSAITDLNERVVVEYNLMLGKEK